MPSPTSRLGANAVEGDPPLIDKHDPASARAARSAAGLWLCGLLLAVHARGVQGPPPPGLLALRGGDLHGAAHDLAV